MKEIYNRLLQVFDNERLDTAAKIAEKFGFNHTTATNYLKKGRVPAVEHLLLIKQKFEYLDLNWLFTGKGEKTFSSEEKIQLLESKMALLEENKALIQEISDLKLANTKLQNELANIINAKTTNPDNKQTA